MSVSYLTEKEYNGIVGLSRPRKGDLRILMSKNRQISLLLLVGCVLMGCGQAEEVNTTHLAVSSYEKINYDWIVMERRDINPQLELGLTSGTYEKKMYFPEYDEMTVDKVNIAVGDLVKKGDVMISFKSGDMEDTLMDLKGSLGQKELLLEHFGNMDEIKSTDRSKLDINQLKADIEADKQEIKEFEAKIASYNMIAEGTGIISSVSQGLENQTVKKGQSLVTVIYGDETFHTQTTDDYPFEVGARYEAEYGATTYPIELISMEEENGAKNLLFKAISAEGEYCSRDRLNLILKKDVLKNVLAVPQESVVYVEDKAYVYLLDDDGFREAVSVTCGQTVEGVTIITSGLTEGDRVVIL